MCCTHLKNILLIFFAFVVAFSSYGSVNLSTFNLEALPYTQDIDDRFREARVIKKAIDEKTDFITFFDDLEITESFQYDRDLFIQAPSITCHRLQMPTQKIVFLSPDGQVTLNNRIEAQALGIQAARIHVASTTYLTTKSLALNSDGSISLAQGAQIVASQHYRLQSKRLDDQSLTLSPDDTLVVADEIEYGSQFQWHTFQADVFAKRRLTLQHGARIVVGDRLHIESKRSVYLNGCIQQPQLAQDYLLFIEKRHRCHQMQYPELFLMPAQRMRHQRGITVKAQGLIESAPSFDLLTPLPVHFQAKQVHHQGKHRVRIDSGSRFRFSGDDLQIKGVFTNSGQVVFEPYPTRLKLDDSKLLLDSQITCQLIQLMNEQSQLGDQSDIRTDHLQVYSRYFSQLLGGRLVSREDMQILNNAVSILSGYLYTKHGLIDAKEMARITGTIAGSDVFVKTKAFCSEKNADIQPTQRFMLDAKQSAILKGLIRGCYQLLSIRCAQDIVVQDGQIKIEGQAAFQADAKLNLQAGTRIESDFFRAQGKHVSVDKQADIKAHESAIFANALNYHGKFYADVGHYDLKRFHVGQGGALRHFKSAQIVARTSSVDGTVEASQLAWKGDDLTTNPNSVVSTRQACFEVDQPIQLGGLLHGASYLNARFKDLNVLPSGAMIADHDLLLTARRFNQAGKIQAKRLLTNLNSLHQSHSGQMKAGEAHIYTSIVADLKGLIESEKLYLHSDGRLQIGTDLPNLSATLQEDDVNISGRIQSRVLNLVSQQLHLLQSGCISVNQHAQLTGKLKTLLEGLVTGNGSVVVYGDDLFVSHMGGVALNGDLVLLGEHAQIDGALVARQIQAQFEQILKVGQLSSLRAQEQIHLLGQLKADIYGYLQAKHVQVETQGTLQQGGSIDGGHIVLFAKQFKQLESSQLDGEKLVQVVSQLQATFNGVVHSCGDFVVQAPKTDFSVDSRQRVQAQTVVTGEHLQVNGQLQSGQLLAHTQDTHFRRDAKVSIAQQSLFDGDIKVFEGGKVDLANTLVKGSRLWLDDNTQVTFKALHVPDADHARLGGDIVLDACHLKARLLEHQARLIASGQIAFEADELDVQANALTDAQLASMVAHQRVDHYGKTIGRQNVYIKSHDGVVPLGTFHSDGWIELDGDYSESQLLDMLSRKQGNFDGSLYVLADIDVTLDRDLVDNKGLGMCVRSLHAEGKRLQTGQDGLYIGGQHDIDLVSVQAQSQGPLVVQSTQGNVSRDGKWDPSARSHQAANWLGTTLRSDADVLIEAGQDSIGVGETLIGHQGVHQKADGQIKSQTASRSYQYSQSQWGGFLNLWRETTDIQETQTQGSQWCAPQGAVTTESGTDSVFEGTRQAGQQGVYNRSTKGGDISYFDIKGQTVTNCRNKLFGLVQTSQSSQTQQVVREVALLHSADQVHVQTQGNITGYGLLTIASEAVFIGKRGYFSRVQEHHKAFNESFGLYVTGAAGHLKHLVKGDVLDAINLGSAKRAAQGINVLMDDDVSHVLDNATAAYTAWCGAGDSIENAKMLFNNPKEALGQSLQLTDVDGNIKPAIGLGIGYQKEETECTTFAPAGIQVKHLLLNFEQECELDNGYCIDAETGHIKATDFLARGAKCQQKCHKQGKYLEFTRRASGIIDVEAGYHTSEHQSTSEQQGQIHFTDNANWDVDSATFQGVDFQAKSIQGRLNHLNVISFADTTSSHHEGGMIGGLLINGAFVPTRFQASHGDEQSTQVRAISSFVVKDGFDARDLDMSKVDLKASRLQAGDNACIDVSTAEVQAEHINEHFNHCQNTLGLNWGIHDVNVNLGHQSEHDDAKVHAAIYAGKMNTGKVKGFVKKFNQAQASDQRERGAYRKRNVSMTGSISKETLRQFMPAARKSKSVPLAVNSKRTDDGDNSDDPDPEDFTSMHTPSSSQNKPSYSPVIVEAVDDTPDPDEIKFIEVNAPVETDLPLAPPIDITDPVRCPVSTETEIDELSIAELETQLATLLQQAESLHNPLAQTEKAQASGLIDQFKQVWQRLTQAESGYLGQWEAEPTNYLHHQALLEKVKVLLDSLPFEHHCFPGETLVLTQSGFKPIAWVTTEDQVLSRVDIADAPCWQPVKQIFQNHVNELIHLKIAQQITGLQATLNHPFAVVHALDQIKWVQAQDLQIGDLLLDADGQCHQIDAVERQLASLTTYNLQVAGGQSYFVAAPAMPRDRSQAIKALWVHNCTPEEFVDKGWVYFGQFTSLGTSIDDMKSILTGRDLQGTPLSDFDRIKLVTLYLASSGRAGILGHWLAEANKRAGKANDLHQIQASLEALQDDNPDVLQEAFLQRAGQRLGQLHERIVPDEWVCNAKGKSKHAKQQDAQASATKQDYVDRSNWSPRRYRHDSTNKMRQEVLKNQGPRGVIRVDKSDIEKNDISHVHFKNGAALNYDGTWKHGHAILTKEQKKWLLKHGWTLPKN